MSWLRDMVKAAALKTGYEVRKAERTGSVSRGIVHEKVWPRSTYAPWRSDQVFLAIYEQVRHSTAVDIYRCYGLWQAVRQALKFGPPHGLIVEVGCWRGGTGILMAARVRDLAAAYGERQTVLFDTFSGVVKAGANDTGYRGGEFSDATPEQVRVLAEAVGLKSVTICLGIFPEQTGREIEDQPVTFAHIDVDTHDSARDAFAFIFKQLVVGGIVVFDDYGFLSTEGIIRFVNELAGDDRVVVTHSLSGQAIVVRVA